MHGSDDTVWRGAGSDVVEHPGGHPWAKAPRD